MTLTIPSDQRGRIEELEQRLVPGLRPLAGLAYDYRWSWHADGAGVFAAIDPARWAFVGQNPVRFLAGLPRQAQLDAEHDAGLVERIGRAAGEVADVTREPASPAPGLDGPVAFFCAEFGIHVSLPVYSGGLGVLAGDILKEASDRGLAMVAIGLLYRRGYFCQRVDASGWQQEYWLDHDPEELPLARAWVPDGEPLRLSTPLMGGEVAFQVLAASVGRVPLLLLDAGIPENDAVARWTSGRLYEGSPEVRLAQYGLLGVGGAQVLAALGIDPAVIHLNEGHPALAPVVSAAARAGGAGLDEAVTAVRDRVVFTTHTPLAAGNETYPPELSGAPSPASRSGWAPRRYLERLAGSGDGAAWGCRRSRCASPAAATRSADSTARRLARSGRPPSPTSPSTTSRTARTCRRSSASRWRRSSTDTSTEAGGARRPTRPRGRA